MADLIRSYLNDLFPAGVPTSVVDPGALFLVVLIVLVVLAIAWNTLVKVFGGVIESSVERRPGLVVFLTPSILLAAGFAVFEHFATAILVALVFSGIVLWQLRRPEPRRKAKSLLIQFGLVLVAVAGGEGLMPIWDRFTEQDHERVYVSPVFEMLRGSIPQAELLEISNRFRSHLADVFSAAVDVQPASLSNENYSDWTTQAVLQRFSRQRDLPVLVLCNRLAISECGAEEKLIYIFTTPQPLREFDAGCVEPKILKGSLNDVPYLSLKAAFEILKDWQDHEYLGMNTLARNVAKKNLLSRIVDLGRVAGFPPERIRSMTELQQKDKITDAELEEILLSLEPVFAFGACDEGFERQRRTQMKSLARLHYDQ